LAVLGILMLGMWLLCAPISTAQPQRPERPQTAVTSPTVGIEQAGTPPTVKIWTDKGDDKSGDIPIYYVGERIYVSFQVDKDSYVTIYDIDSTGNVNILFPNPYHTDNLARGGRIYTLPSTNYDYDLVIQGPTGKEVLYALVSTHIYYHWQYCETPPVWSDNWGSPCTWGHAGTSDQSLLTKRFQKRLQAHEETNLTDLMVTSIKQQIKLDATVGCAGPRSNQEACQTSFYVTIPPY
jgi:predicted small metal-binding protein